MSVIKNIAIKNASGTGYDSRDIGAEAENIVISRDANGEIITDLSTQTVVTTESLAQTAKDIEDSGANAAPKNHASSTNEYGAADASHFGHVKLGTGLAVNGTSGSTEVSFGTIAGTACEGNDSRLSDDRANPNAVTFSDGLSTPTTVDYDGSVAKTITYSTVGAAPKSHASANTEYGVASTTVFGHVKVGTGLNVAAGVVSAPIMTGASASASGQAGIVPAPSMGDQDKFLCADGTWKEVQGGGTDIPIGDVSGASATQDGASVTLTWSDPDDVVIQGITFAAWAGTTLVRKAGSAPSSVSDGTVITTNSIKNQYSSTGYVDSNGLNFGVTYYYRFFPYKMSGSTKVYTTGTALNIALAREIIQTVPTQDGSLTYDGTSQTPSWNDYDSSKMTIGGVTSSIDAGTYTATFTPVYGYCWSDSTTSAKNVSWTIDQAAADATLSKSTVSLDTTTTTDTVTVSNNTGTISVTSSDNSIATAVLSGDTITIEGLSNGSVTVTVSIAASADGNYAAGSKTIAVTVVFASLVSWSSGTDEQIATMIDAYYAGTFSLADVKTVWHVGDIRNISLAAMSATGVGESHRAQTVQVQIIDFDHDTLTTSINGKTKALITVDLKNCLRDASVSDTGGSSNTEHGYMNSSNTNVGGWTSCARRTWCNDVFYAALPTYLKNKVKPVNKLTSAGNQSSTINTDSDKCFLLSEIEIFGTVSQSKSREGTQYSHYATASNRYKLPKWSASNSSDNWWERSPRGSNATSFCLVVSGGNASDSVASFAYGLAPAFAL